MKALNRRTETGILHRHDPRHVDVLFESLGLENGNTVQTPTIDDLKRRESSVVTLRINQQVEISCGQMLVLQSRKSRQNIRRERVVPKNVRSFTTQLFQIEATRSEPEGREAMDPGFRIRGHELGSDSFLGLRLGW